jgi:hypothetical protein
VERELELKTPVKMGPETIEKLTFKQPKGRDMMQCGYPFRVIGVGMGITSEVQRAVDTKVVGAFISNLAQIPPFAVNELSVPDFNAAMEIVLSFFQ